MTSLQSLMTVGLLFATIVEPVRADDLLESLSQVREYARQCLTKQQGRVTTRARPLAAGVRAKGSQTNSTRRWVLRLLHQASLAHGVDPALAKAVAYVESNLDPSAVSEKGAVGVMQLMPVVASEYGINRHDLRHNIETGVRYLRRLTGAFGLRAGLAAYNAGPGRIERGERWPAETVRFVEAVMARFEKLSG